LPGPFVWDHCHAGRSRHVSSSRLSLMEGGFGLKSHDTWPCSFLPQHISVFLSLLQKNSPKARCFLPLASWCSWDATLHSSSSKHDELSFYQKSSILVSSDHMIFSQSSSGSPTYSLANFRWAWTRTGLSRGKRLALQDLSPSRCSVLLMVAFVILVPALCKSFIRSLCVVLGFLLTVLMIIFEFGV